MKKLKKFTLYFIGFLVISYLLIDSVDYPFQHEQRIAKEQARQIASQPGIKPSPEEEDSASNSDHDNKSFSDDIRSLGDSFEEFVSTIRNIKEGLKTARCGGKMMLQLWRIDMRLDDVPDDIAYEAFIASGVRVHELDIFSLDREEITDEQRDADYKERMVEMYRRFEEQPTEYNTHQALNLCNEGERYTYNCSEEQIANLRNNLSDSLQGWMLQLETHDPNDLSSIGDYIDMAIRAPVDQSLRRQTFMTQFELINSIADNRRLAMMMATSAADFNGPGIRSITRFCSSVVRDERCLQLADRLEAEATTNFQLDTAYKIRRTYHRIDYNEEQLKQLQSEFYQKRANQATPPTPIFSDEYIDYALETMQQYDHLTTAQLLRNKANELMNQDPDMCAF
jgi:hypothetical protein